ncbi:MAG: MFS transporter, partial [Gaiellales bacterium]
HSAGGRVITAVFPERHLGLVLSIRHVAIPVGAAIGGVLVPVLTTAYGLAWVALGSGGAGLFAAVILAVLIPSARTASARRERAQAPATGASPLRLRAMWLLAAGAGSLAFVQLGIGSFLTVQLVDRAGVSLTIAAGVFTVAQLLGGGGRLVLGIWSDRVRDRVRVLLWVAISAAMLVTASWIVQDPLTSALLQAGALVAVTSCNGVVVAVAASLAPAGRTGATLGMQTTANAAACAIAPILLGLLLTDRGWGSYLAALLIVLTISLLALLRLLQQRAQLATT